MSETWEQTKARLRRQGIYGQKDVVIIEPPKPPMARYEEPQPEPRVKLFNIHKRSLPPGIDKIVVFGVTKSEAEWWIERRLKTKCYENGPDESKTIIYYDVIPVDAKPRERSIFFNPRPIIAEGAE